VKPENTFTESPQQGVGGTTTDRYRDPRLNLFGSFDADSFRKRSIVHDRLQPENRFPYLLLAKSYTLEGVLLGEGATTSTQFVAIRMLAQDPQADAAFKELIETASLAGSFYGLIGARQTDPAYFADAVVRFQHSPVEISTWSGCMHTYVPISMLAGEIANNPSIWNFFQAFFASTPDAPTSRTAVAP
jgi:hypothetical protein